MMPYSYGIVDRGLKTLILLNAGPHDRVDIILVVDFRTNIVTMERYYEGIYERVLFEDYKVLRIIFRTKNDWSLVTARSTNASGQVLDREEIKGMASFALGCKLMFLESFEDAVKINRLGKEKDYQGNCCIICHEEYKSGDMMATLMACKHGYHVVCIQNWLMKKFSCPICRERVFHNPIYVDHVILTQHMSMNI
ncbi:hypothetical protein QVD17_23034 [Tagetes erecta]|uniref:RING-type domain-containing protein n=1 Tax=Tagetes erecta TaxID=13708 RepID=A0AAD8KDL0_TARER|nr:hypothetical protein QVD17_23034 [Tagetes erecta]